MISILISLVIWAVIFYVLYWAVGAMALPEPFAKVIMIVLILAAVIVVIGLLMGSVAPFAFLPFK
jgi:hypothetical protein